ncbi:hypothetical protein D2V17_15855 [Aurantiacibacter xanthus]|uniref:Calcium-dependent phosphoinositide phospholipase C n=2 Tax=Aurantiacibacter xanthus TaxID=1784712 RepID=A0A3A1P606_9SPHN|nr:hypothetical protein D2V17_15855 [Aurantiacibacter xanthus]
MMRSHTLGAALLCLAAIGPLAPVHAQESEPTDANAPPEAAQLPGDLPINRIQVLGTHNSYSLGTDPRVRAMLDERIPSMHKITASIPAEALEEFRTAHPNDVTIGEALSYRYTSLTDQLERGVRSLEIDLNADPQGGAYADPAAYRILRAQGVSDLAPFDPAPLAEPGLKVLHMPDIDFRSSCPTFHSCLAEMKAWSADNPGHVPIFVMLEAKVQALGILPGSAQVPPFTPATYDQIDRDILDIIGRENVITPDDVRGDHSRLEDAVLAGEWPDLAQARGKFVFLLITATGKNGASDYLIGHPGLRERVAFLDSVPGQDFAAFILNDNAIDRGDQIRDQVAKGYLVRTRADIETWEAKVDDMTRARAAFASGAQIVSTDFIEPGNAYGTPYIVELPGGEPARIAPRPGD